MEARQKRRFRTFLDDIENLVIPEDLKFALEQNKVAQENFETVSDFSKKADTVLDLPVPKGRTLSCKELKKQPNWQQRTKTI